MGVATGVAGLVEGDGVGADPDGGVTLEATVHHAVQARHRVPGRLVANRTCRLEEQPEAGRTLLTAQVGCELGAQIGCEVGAEELRRDERG